MALSIPPNGFLLSAPPVNQSPKGNVPPSETKEPFSTYKLAGRVSLMNPRGRTVRTRVVSQTSIRTLTPSPPISEDSNPLLADRSLSRGPTASTSSTDSKVSSSTRKLGFFGTIGEAFMRAASSISNFMKAHFTASGKAEVKAIKELESWHDSFDSLMQSDSTKIVTDISAGRNKVTRNVQHTTDHPTGLYLELLYRNEHSDSAVRAQVTTAKDHLTEATKLVEKHTDSLSTDAGKALHTLMETRVQNLKEALGYLEEPGSVRGTCSDPQFSIIMHSQVIGLFKSNGARKRAKAGETISDIETTKANIKISTGLQVSSTSRRRQDTSSLK